MLRTSERIQQMLEERKRIKQREKEKEKQKYKKASEAIKLQIKKKKIQEIQEKPKETHHLQFSITIYHSNLIERESDEEKLYTLQELQHIEELYPEEKGRINWTVWNKLINEFKKKGIIGY